MPLAVTSIFPTGWAAAHRPTAEDVLVSTCVVVDPGAVTPGTFDPNTGATGAATNPTPMYIGSCRVQALHLLGRGAAEIAGQEITNSRYLVQLPVSAVGVEPRFEVTVTASDDPDLVGKLLTVDTVLRGSTPWLRDLQCTLDEG